jgi:hypothetical protein
MICHLIDRAEARTVRIDQRYFICCQRRGPAFYPMWTIGEEQGNANGIARLDNVPFFDPAAVARFVFVSFHDLSSAN